MNLITTSKNLTKSTKIKNGLSTIQTLAMHAKNIITFNCFLIDNRH